MEDVKLHLWVLQADDLSLMEGTYHKPPKSKAKQIKLQHTGIRTSCTTGGQAKAKQSQCRRVKRQKPES